MKSKKLRDLTFTLHRYIGLAVGLILVIVGLTGSLLVFEKEIDHFLLNLQIEHIVPQGERVSIESVVDTVKAAYADAKDLKIASINMLPPESPYKVWLKSPADKWTEVFVNPYTGKILGTRQSENTLIGFTFKLHYQLLAGEVGTIVVGIAALLLFILCITGLVLWPGWRKLISGFKIKWLAHPKRVHFDIHKVAGIIAVVFLAMIAFTGFCWNFYDFTKPVIYAVTLTPIPDVPVSKPIAGKSPLGITEILQKADAALPGAITTFISLPEKPEEAFRIRKKFPQETEEYGRSQIYLDQYSGKIVQMQNALSPSLGDSVLNSFGPLHYGTFGGLATRILYVFVGFSPTLLFVTGFVMWQYRWRAKTHSQDAIPQLQGVKESCPQMYPTSEWPWML